MPTVHAQSSDLFVYLPEGQTQQGDVEVPQGDSRIVLDMNGGRLDHATGNVNLGATANSPALLTGELGMQSGVDDLWLRAQGTTTASVFEGTARLADGRTFGSVGYEASGNDSVLTLTAPSAGGNNEMEQTLRLGGDGRIIVEAVVNTTGTPDRSAIVVYDASTSRGLGEGGDGKIDLVIRANISGQANNSEALVDARAADSVTVESNTTISTTSGYALNAGDAETVVEASAFVQIRETSLATEEGSAAIRTTSSVDNLGTISGINTRVAGGTNAQAIDATNATITNRRNGGQVGKIQASGDAILTRGNTLIVNDGEISSLFGAAVQAQGINSNTVLRNGAQGLIRVGAAFESTGTSTTAYQGVNGTDVIVNEGQIAGNVDLSGGNDIFLVKGNGSITGTISGGAGDHDAYGRSYSETATVALADNILNVDGRSGFEMHGIEASGADTTVTVTAEGTLSNGIQMIGDGTVINEADISAGTGYGAYVRGIANVPGGGIFINRGNISSSNYALMGEDVSGRIVNEGALSGSLGVRLDIGEDAEGDLDFVNSGTISALSQNSSGLTANIENVGHLARFVNSATGSIFNNTAGSNADSLFGLNIRSRAGRVELDNDGEIWAASRTDGGARIEARSIDVDNSGTIEGRGAGGSGLTIIATGTSESGDPETVASVRNSGTIRGNGGGTDIDGGTGLAYGFGAQIHGDNAIVELENDGTIESTGADSVAVLVHANNPDGASRAFFRMVNRGTIRGSGTDTVLAENDLVRRTAMDVPGAISDSSYERVVASAIQTYGTTDHIVNQGDIIGNVDLADGDDWFENRGTVEGDVRMGEGDDAYVIALGSTLTGSAYGGDGTDTLFIDGSGDQNGRLDAAHYREFERIAGLPGAQQGTGILSVVGDFDVDTVGLANVSIQIDAGDTVGSQGQYMFTGSDGAERITNNGTITGSIDLGAGDDIVVNSGIVQGDVLLGAGNDRYVARAGSVIEGLLDAGDGIDTFEFLLADDTGNLPSGLIGFESYAARGQGTINVTLDQDIDTIELLDGANLILNDGTGTIQNIVGDDSNNIVTVTGTLAGGVNLGGGDDTLNLTLSGILSGALDGGAGSDTLNLTLAGASTINGMNGFEVANIFGEAQLTLGSLGAGQTVNFDGSSNELIIASGAAFDGIVNGGDGRDLLRIQSGAEDSRTVVASQILNFEDLESEGPGTLALTGGAYSFQTVSVDGALELGANTSLASADGVVFGAADNRFRLGSGATVTGGVDGGAGDDLLQLEQGEGIVRALSSVGATNFERLESSGAGELRIDTDALFDLVSIDGGLTTIVAGTTLTAPVVGGGGNDTLAVLGTLVGDVHMGAGDDRLILANLDPANSYAGGAGADTIEFRTAATYENPLEFNGDEVSDFERLAVSGGVVSLTGDTSWDGVAITGGRLIGQAGTTITSSSAILVGAGATFGSAGTVNADIDVRGTLSPGASPGTMTVNGDVIFRTGSNLLLELTPTVSDLLNISGTMTIEQGAAVDITGVLQGAPGELLDLVVAEGGIEGRFTTINKSDTIFGFVVQNGNRLQIRSEFENDAAYPSNVRTSIDYSNQVLRGGYGVQAYTDALNVLTDAEGRANQTAFAQLTGEAYASALHIGTDAALTLSNSTRQMAAFAPVRDGLFVFGQAAFGDGKLRGSARTGASAGQTSTDGVLGGVGYGFGESGQAGLFIGSLDTRQSIGALGAETKADGFAVGAYANARLGGFDVHAMLARVGSDATTSRSLLAAPSATAVGRYDLDSWVADLTVDYGMTVGDLRVAPRAGLTYVDTKREAVAERGAGAFALSVDEKHMRGLYADLALQLSSTIEAGGTAITPYVEMGYRFTLDGMSATATGGFTGAPGEAMRVDGARLDRSAANLAAGASIDLAPAVRVNVGYSRDLAKSDRGTFTGGLSIRF
ncbi:MAG TPA: autotransporter domain-containing protein [Sphingopyxis sp.]|uniref:autotransporter domain-containing protein n=1 Tax=Sphingopyxis sp. TaxID=1908224 RepID=UPI002B8BC615|nr:autotransporter domain-containing protein [Sphingopyxis sp.]HWW57055.1 autotransporter domain-containing protein [Sphingopyxis sp.]